MKIKNYLALCFLAIGAGALQSCDDTTSDFNIVNFRVKTDDDVVFSVGRVNGIDLNLNTKGPWEYKIRTNKEYTGINVMCENEYANLYVSVYKSSRLITSKQGNRHVYIPYVKLK